MRCESRRFCSVDCLPVTFGTRNAELGALSEKASLRKELEARKMLLCSCSVSSSSTTLCCLPHAWFPLRTSRALRENSSSLMPAHCHCSSTPMALRVFLAQWASIYRKLPSLRKSSRLTSQASPGSYKGATTWPIFRNIQYAKAHARSMLSSRYRFTTALSSLFQRALTSSGCRRFSEGRESGLSARWKGSSRRGGFCWHLQTASYQNR